MDRAPHAKICLGLCGVSCGLSYEKYSVIRGAITTMKTQLEKTLDDASKSVRMWATWKLKSRNIDVRGQEYSTWETMSKHDQDFNLVWN